MNALALNPNHELLIDVLDEAEQRGLILITDGFELKYTLPNAIPLGWTRFVMKAKPRLLDPKEPRL